MKNENNNIVFQIKNRLIFKKNDLYNFFINIFKV